MPKPFTKRLILEFRWEDYSYIFIKTPTYETYKNKIKKRVSYKKKYTQSFTSHILYFICCTSFSGKSKMLLILISLEKNICVDR